MVIYPVPIEVTQARVQLVADQTAKAPARTIIAVFPCGSYSS